MLQRVEEMERIFVVVEGSQETEIRIVGEKIGHSKNCFIRARACDLPADAVAREERAIERRIEEKKNAVFKVPDIPAAARPPNSPRPAWVTKQHYYRNHFPHSLIRRLCTRNDMFEIRSRDIRCSHERQRK